MGAYNYIDDVASLRGNHLINIVTAVRDDDNNGGSLLCQKCRLFADGIALIAEDYLSSVGNILQGGGLEGAM